MGAERIAVVKPDAKGRLSLGRYLPKVAEYSVYPTPTGGVIIEPITEEEGRG